MEHTDEQHPIIRLPEDQIPDALREIPQQPKQLYYRGALPDWSRIFLTVVGSRHYTGYGESVTQKLIAGLVGYPVTVVSGLAMGIDAIAHEVALANNIPTIAFPGSGLDWSVIYPAYNRKLAERILQSGGALFSELPHTQGAALWTFPRRNRLMAGIARATLVIECTKKSGTLITARLALDYNRDLLTIPGPIFAESSSGPNELLRQGAIPITSVDDLLAALGLVKSETNFIDDETLSPDEKKVIHLLMRSPRSRDDLVIDLEMPAQEVNTLLSLMEIKGLINEKLGQFWMK